MKITFLALGIVSSCCWGVLLILWKLFLLMDTFDWYLLWKAMIG